MIMKQELLIEDSNLEKGWGFIRKDDNMSGKCYFQYLIE